MLILKVLDGSGCLLLFLENNNMNILLIIPSATGTIAHVSYNLYSGFCKTEHNIYVACLDSREAKYRFQNCYTVVYNSNFFINQIKKILFVRKLKKELSIDISISTLLASSVINVLSGSSDYKIGVFHAPISQTKNLGIKTYLSCLLSYKFIINNLDKLVAFSESVKDDVQKFVNKKVDVIYNIHDFRKIEALGHECIGVDEIDGFSQPYIICVGHLFEVKKCDRLIKAFSIVLKKAINQKLKLIFLGDGDKDYIEYLISLTHTLSLTDNVIFAGHKDNPYKFMKNSLFLVSSSKSEGLPGVIIEALSLNIPVVATNSSYGIWEIMDCKNNYQKKLTSIYETKYGFITPNVSDESLVIEQLSIAISTMLKQSKSFIFDRLPYTHEYVVSRFLKK